jgi:hypothetical protein
MIFSKCCNAIPVVTGTINSVTIRCPQCGNMISFGHSIKDHTEIKEICNYYWADLVERKKKKDKLNGGY